MTNIARTMERALGRKRYVWQRALFKVLGHIVVFGVGLFFLVPALWMFFTAFKSSKDVFRFPPTLLPYDNQYVTINGKAYPLYNVPVNGEMRQLAALKIAEGQGTFVNPNDPTEVIETRARYAEPIFTIKFQWRNFSDAINRGVRPGLKVNFWTYLKNSLIVAFFTIIGTLLSCVPAAYGFSRIQWPGRELVFMLVLSTMMLPYQVTMIPLYLLFTETLKWGNSLLPIIVPSFFANAFDIFLLRQFFRTIPEDLVDAARVDGASELHILLKLIIPLSTPILAAITVFTFLWAWNDFLGPLLYLNNPEKFTLAIGLQDFQGQRNTEWNQLMAAAVVFTVPIIIAYFFAQRTFIEGIKLTGTKG
ncbi:MAG TPA: carbohydrate ABC transporter permease [Anaerolineae bacterium]|nr:carbohydrate ABC transporter permease [Anaerolineae bacterium]HQI85070.1 carbohydrate ABC transporter permease [Anaerolineae bacterium]